MAHCNDNSLLLSDILIEDEDQGHGNVIGIIGWKNYVDIGLDRGISVLIGVKTSNQSLHCLVEDIDSLHGNISMSIGHEDPFVT